MLLGRCQLENASNSYFQDLDISRKAESRMTQKSIRENTLISAWCLLGA